MVEPCNTFRGSELGGPSQIEGREKDPSITAGESVVTPAVFPPSGNEHMMSVNDSPVMNVSVTTQATSSGGPITELSQVLIQLGAALRQLGTSQVSQGAATPQQGTPVSIPPIDGTLLTPSTIALVVELFEDQMKRVQEFLKLNPRTYRGDPDIIKAELWIGGVEKNFEILGGSEHERIALAAYKLEGDAEIWWKLTKRNWELAGREWIWANFVMEFRRQFVPTVAHQKHVQAESSKSISGRKGQRFGNRGELAGQVDRPQRFGTSRLIRSSVGMDKLCGYCGNQNHTEDECWKKHNRCLRCGAKDHKVVSCPRIKTQKIPEPGVNQGTVGTKRTRKRKLKEHDRVLNLGQQGVQDSTDEIGGILIISHPRVSTLVYPGSSYSYVVTYLVYPELLLYMVVVIIYQG